MHFVNRYISVAAGFVLTGKLIVISIILTGCGQDSNETTAPEFNYQVFKDSISKAAYDTTGDGSNVFDNTRFIPGKDSVTSLLNGFDTAWRRDVSMMRQVDTIIRLMKAGDTVNSDQKAAIAENLNILDSFLKNKRDTLISHCREKACFLYAEIIKSSQVMYLYVSGEIADSFKVSTGIRGRETPNINTRPSGPIFTKYTSKKFPGGNYMGLGNMPYAVFIRGGYAIHGTTPGNFSKLGRRASHGCIRLHPYNARIFYELVKRVGLSNTWVRIKDA